MYQFLRKFLFSFKMTEKNYRKFACLFSKANVDYKANKTF